MTKTILNGKGRIPGGIDPITANSSVFYLVTITRINIIQTGRPTYTKYISESNKYGKKSFNTINATGCRPER